MNAIRPTALPAHLTVILTLARLLERLENSGVAMAADQYRSVVSHLAAELGKVTPDATLHALLDAHPAAAELYENLHYEQSGLSQSSLERSVGSEMLASQVLAKAARKN